MTHLGVQYVAAFEAEIYSHQQSFFFFHNQL